MPAGSTVEGVDSMSRASMFDFTRPRSGSVGSVPKGNKACPDTLSVQKSKGQGRRRFSLVTFDDDTGFKTLYPVSSVAQQEA